MTQEAYDLFLLVSAICYFVAVFLVFTMPESREFYRDVATFWREAIRGAKDSDIKEK